MATDELSDDWLGVPNCPDCKVIKPGFHSRDEARDLVFQTLTDFLGPEAPPEYNEAATFTELGLEKERLRKFELKFYIHCDVTIQRDNDGGRKYAVPDSELPQVPPTLMEFIERVYSNGRYPLFQACFRHW